MLPPVKPGELTERLDGPPPEAPQPLAEIMRDLRTDVIPNVTHWQSPSNLAYFSSERVGHRHPRRAHQQRAQLECLHLARLAGGHGAGGHHRRLAARGPRSARTTSTASSTTRPRSARSPVSPALGSKPPAMPPRRACERTAPLRLYISSQAHSSIERAAMILGIGRDGVRAIDVDDELAMDPVALRDAIAAGPPRTAGCRPASWPRSARPRPPPSTRSTPSPMWRRDEGLWLHVDAAYAGPVALIPQMRRYFTGWERADSDRGQPAQVDVHAASTARCC